MILSALLWLLPLIAPFPYQPTPFPVRMIQQFAGIYGVETQMKWLWAMIFEHVESSDGGMVVSFGLIAFAWPQIGSYNVHEHETLK